MSQPTHATPSWLASLAPAAAKAIKAHAYTSIAEVREAIMSGSLDPEFSPNLGVKTFRVICAWCDVPIPRRRAPQVPRVASPQALARAKRTLERAGYTVLAPATVLVSRDTVDV